MGNMDLYNKMRGVPKEAQKEIKGGRLKGMTDINSMWRIKKLTEEFGPAGEGWQVENVNFWTVPADATGEVAAFCSLEIVINGKGRLYGIGGSKLVVRETSGLYCDDECYKKAYTDAISVACKSIGMGADVYFSGDNDRTKYSAPPFEPIGSEDLPPVKKDAPAKKSNYQIVKELVDGKDVDVAALVKLLFGTPIKVNDLEPMQFAKLCEEITKRCA